MKLHSPAMLAAVVVLTLAPAHVVRGQTPPSAAKTLASLKPGQWIRLEGTPQRDQSVLCTKITVLTAPQRETDWSVLGALRSVDAAKKEVAIGRYRIRFVAKPKLKGSAAPISSLSQLKAGTLVKVEGTYSKDGSFLATKLDDESARSENNPDKLKALRLQGKVERVDAARRAIMLMGTKFQVTDQTRVVSRG